MRIRLVESKKIVLVKHFQYKAKHIELLTQLCAELPEMYLEGFYSDSGSPVRVRLEELDLDPEELRFLNP